MSGLLFAQEQAQVFGRDAAVEFAQAPFSGTPGPLNLVCARESAFLFAESGDLTNKHRRSR